MADYTFRSTTDRGKLSEFTLKITTDRSAAALYENDRLILNFSYIWRTTTSTSTTTSTTYVPKAIHFFLVPNVCSTSSTPKIQDANVYDLGTFQFGNFTSGGNGSAGPITKFFNLSQQDFNKFLSATTSTDSTIKILKTAGSYIDQTPVYLKIGYEIDYGDYKPDTFAHGSSIAYKPLYYGNLGISIKGTIERCDDTGSPLEQGEYIHWKSLYLESLATTLYNNTQPSTYIKSVESIRLGIEQKYGEIKWEELIGKSGIYSDRLITEVVKKNRTTIQTAYSESYTPITSCVLAMNFTQTLGSNVILQISFRSDLNGIYTGNFTIERAQAKLHISGWKDGGVAIGKFSSSSNPEQQRPLFEVDASHESIFGGAVNFNQGINTVGSEYCVSSLNALGIQSGYWATPRAFCNNISDNKVAKSKSKIYNVSFPRPYAESPIVNVTLCNTTDPTNAARVYNCVKCTYNIETISTTGFSVKVLNISSTDRYPNFTWLAMGKIIESDRGGTVRRPDQNRPMTRNNEGTLIAAASSQYSSSYAAYKAFDNTTTNYWRSAASKNELWIGLYLGVKIKNTTLIINNSSGTHPRGIYTGRILLYNTSDPENPFATLPNSTPYGASLDSLSELGPFSIACNNTSKDNDPNDDEHYFDTVLIRIDKFYNGSGSTVDTISATKNYCQIGQITITGDLKKSTGNSSGQEETDPESPE